MGHPSVADAGVVGAATATGETVGVAFVVPSPGSAASAEELLAFCRGRLTASQVPASITFVDALPRNAVGKLVREDLRMLIPRVPHVDD
jgi:acyl-coenzyme A synthetase/AMP-(fatty) acid ligase